MEIRFDLLKDATNTRKHRISLARTEDFDFDARLYSLTFTQEGETIRPISLRKATKYEEDEYQEGR